MNCRSCRTKQMKELYISNEIKQAKTFLSSHDCKREWWKQAENRAYHQMKSSVY